MKSDTELIIKMDHIKNIKSILNLKDPESADHAIFAFHLYEIVKKWGLHFLPLRMLYDLDYELMKEVRKIKNG